MTNGWAREPCSKRTNQHVARLPVLLHCHFSNSTKIPTKKQKIGMYYLYEAELLLSYSDKNFLSAVWNAYFFSHKNLCETSYFLFSYIKTYHKNYIAQTRNSFTHTHARMYTHTLFNDFPFAILLFSFVFDWTCFLSENCYNKWSVLFKTATKK